MKQGSRYHKTLTSRILTRIRRQPRGQSFLELTVVVLILALLLSGMVEFGFMLNNYLHVLDGSREGARYSSSSNPFQLDVTGVSIQNFYYPPFYYVGAGKAVKTLEPVTLDPTYPDDVVISVYSLNGEVPTIFPTDDPNGWSLCAHYNANTEDSAVGYSGFAAYFQGIDSGFLDSDLPPATWGAGCTVRTSQFTATSLQAAIHGMNASTATKTGAVLVEIYYNYPQLLKLPVFTAVLPDPIPLYVFSLMPLSAAQPTQVP